MVIKYIIKNYTLRYLKVKINMLLYKIIYMYLATKKSNNYINGRVTPNCFIYFP